jgi:predicted transcriptional regulator YdeE
MNSKHIDPFHIIGLAIRTTNENGQSAQDIPALWGKFMGENTIAQIPGKADEAIYSVYCEYEKDHTKPYTTVLGCRVNNLDEVPEGMKGITIEGGNYTEITAKGKLMDGIVLNEWVKIWNSDIPRVFTADFEVYGAKAQNPDNAEVEIWLAVK